jgi:cysteine desulfurase
MEARKKIQLPHIITSTIEHSSVLETVKMLESYGLAKAIYLKPDINGLFEIEALKNAITKDTVLVSLALVNGELGTILNIEDVLKTTNKAKEENYNLKSMHLTNQAYYPYLHLDASQAAAHMDISKFVKKGVDLISFNSVKIGGPAGIGLLFKKRSIILSKIYSGGEQEMGLRPGTQSALLATGFAKALEITKNNLSQNENNYIQLKKILLDELNKIKKEYNFNIIQNSTECSIPSIVNISFPYFSGQQMAIELDARGVMVSSKSACKSEDENESYVVGEIRKNSDVDTYNNYGSIRISFGPDTKNKDIIKLINALNQVLKTYKGVLY